MTTKLWAILTLLFTTLLTSSAQILYKKGVDSFGSGILGIVTNQYLIGGMILYAIGGILMIISFRGGEVSVLYPIIATSYVWVSFLSIFFLNEHMSTFKWLGVVTIIAGIASIGLGSRSRNSAPGVM
ncbi:MAG TPA: EamA family transporter [Candidatus Nanoarchaeia archaeon]|nr:EamA family transporter [Candidatus Nanoarchaeia archaeon]